MVTNMIMIFCGLFFVLGLTMSIRGWIYTLKPEGAIARKRQQKNLRLGFTSDMKVFGRKIRRLGYIFMLAGGLWGGRFFL